jgi:hypothetical protein
VTVDPMGTQRKSWLQRLLGRSKNVHLSMNVKRRESLSLTVPSNRADAIRAALERWLGEHGITTPVTAEDAGSGKTRLKASLNEADSQKLDLTDSTVQSQLQDLLTNAASSSSS